MTLPPRARKVALVAHVLASVGWLGAVGAFLALTVVGLTSADAPLVRAAYLVLDPVARFVIVPLALASLLTGLVESWGTSWGLVRHYWVLVKFGITVVAVLVLLQQLEPIARLADTAARGVVPAGGVGPERISVAVHAGGGLLLLLVPLVLSVFKPRGRTRYEQRRRTRLPV